MTTEPTGQGPEQAAAILLAAAQRENARLRELERDARRQAEILKRSAHRLAAAVSPREVAETAMLEVKAMDSQGVMLLLELASTSRARDTRLELIAPPGSVAAELLAIAHVQDLPVERPQRSPTSRLAGPRPDTVGVNKNGWPGHEARTTRVRERGRASLTEPRRCCSQPRRGRCGRAGTGQQQH